MRLRSILAALAVVACGSLFGQNSSLVVDFPIGDSRANWKEPNVYYSKKVKKEKIEEYENTRERHDLLIAALGPDKDWEADVAKAKEEGGYVVEAVIKYGENIEMCMSPADAANVTHLKLSGRAYQWYVYGPDDLKLADFLNRMPKLKVLNLRDLDCELYWVRGPKTLQKLVFPANCASTIFTYIPPQIVYPSNRLLAIGYEAVENGKRVFSMGDIASVGVNTSNLKEMEFPEGLLYIAELWVREDCQKLVFPSTLKRIESFGRAGSFGDVTAFQIKNLREVHLKSATPPELGHFDYKYEHLKNATLYVPKGSKSAYTQHLKWRQFGNIVEEDVVLSQNQKNVAPLRNSDLIQGKWIFEKDELYDPANLFKDRQPIQTKWMKVKDGKIEECYLDNGKEIISETKYRVEGNYYYLDVDNGTAKFEIKQLDFENFAISIGVNNSQMNYHITYYYKRANE